jgi:two-component system OmpR family sensor kinase
VTDTTRGGWRAVLGSMRVRIVASMVLLLALSATVSIFVVRELLLDRLDHEIEVDLRTEAEEFALLAEGIDPETGQPFAALRPVFDVYFRREVPDEGESLLTFVGDELYDSERAPDVADAEEFDAAIDVWLGLDTATEGSIDTGVGLARYAAVPLRLGGEDGLFVVANFPEFERAEINDALRTQAITQFATIVAASLLGLALAGRVLRPLRSLVRTAETITVTDLTRRIDVRGTDEASRIAQTFNDMLGRLEQAFATQRKFLDDAGHELRVPLTVVRGHVELLELETDPVERDEMVRIVTDEIERMNRIVEDLLVLAKAGRPDFLIVAPVDVAELTREVHRKARVISDHDWLLDGVADVVVDADGQRLTQALMQLAENASHHTPAGGQIGIGSRVREDGVTLWVRDTGPGVAPEDAERIFQRFVKGPGRREATGLGLSIVAAIAEAHGGTARVAPGHTDGGATFEVVVPFADSALPTSVSRSAHANGLTR